jgi:DDE superfamily endonuclease
LDNAPTHPAKADLLLKDGLLSALYLPSNVTLLIQSMDQSVIVTMKPLYQKTILRELLESIHEQSTTAENFLNSLTPKKRCYIIADGWNSLIKTTLS